MKTREQGSILIFVLIMVLLLGGLMAALTALTRTHFRASAETLDRELAFRAADSGVSYYLGRLIQQPTYFQVNTAPQPTQSLGRASFTLEAASASTQPGQWELLVAGERDGVTSRLRAVIGYEQYAFPAGIALAGTGNPEDVVLRLNGSANIASYDPALGPPDPGSPRDNAGLWVNGSAYLGGSSMISGDLTTTGTVTMIGGSTVTGTVTENGPQVSIDPITEFAGEMVDSSRVANDNGVLGGIFGSDWNPVPGAENYGDLVVHGGEYVIPAGTYRFRRLHILSGAKVTFDTSGGDSNVVFMGGTVGPHSDTLTVASGASVLIDQGGTSNELVTVLGPNTDFLVGSNSTFAKPGDGSSGAEASKIISAGGSGTMAVGSQASAYGRLYAPDRDLVVGGNGAWLGSAAVRTLTLSGGTGEPLFAVDEDAQGSFLTDPTDFEVYARWPDPPQN